MFKKLIEILSPTIERANFMAEIADTKRILNEDTLAPYRTIFEAKLFQGPRPFKTAPVMKINALCAKHFGPGKNFIEATSLVLSNLSSGWDSFEKIADITVKGKVLDKVGISYRQASIIHMLNLMDFFCNYSRMVLLYTLGKEVREFKSLAGTPEPFTKGEIRYLEQHAENWGKCLEIFKEPMPRIMAVIDTVPDIVYDPKTEGAVRAQVGNRVNPLNMGFVPIISDVCLFFGLRYAEKKAKRLLRAEAERKALELRIAQYRQAVLDKPDAVTDKMIEVAEEEVRDLSFEIHEMRRKWGIEE